MQEIRQYDPRLNGYGNGRSSEGAISQLISSVRAFQDREAVQHALVDEHRRALSEKRGKDVPREAAWYNFAVSGFGERFARLYETWNVNGQDFSHLKRMVLEGEVLSEEYEIEI